MRNILILFLFFTGHLCYSADIPKPSPECVPLYNMNIQAMSQYQVGQVNQALSTLRFTNKQNRALKGRCWHSYKGENLKKNIIQDMEEMELE